MTKSARGIISILKKTYPETKIALRFKTPWELLVAVILSAQCTDKRVNIVTERLFQKYKTLDDYVKAPLLAFEQDIKSTGFYHNKAKNILAAARLIKERFDGHVPKTMKELLTIAGIGRKTANIVLGNAYGIVEGIAVDTHVSRLSQRLRLVRVPDGVDFKKDADPVKIERELMNTIPKSDWFLLTYLLIDHGRAVCKARNPQCSACVLSRLCPVSRAPLA